ncbi:MAG: hypothetical protein FWD27_06150 [Coriobacteriia bacterium]|nr:hypothetical protein [Coriobacteriia bacterium]
MRHIAIGEAVARYFRSCQFPQSIVDQIIEKAIQMIRAANDQAAKERKGDKPS